MGLDFPPLRPGSTLPIGSCVEEAGCEHKDVLPQTFSGPSSSNCSCPHQQWWAFLPTFQPSQSTCSGCPPSSSNAGEAMNMRTEKQRNHWFAHTWGSKVILGLFISSCCCLCHDTAISSRLGGRGLCIFKLSTAFPRRYLSSLPLPDFVLTQREHDQIGKRPTSPTCPETILLTSHLCHTLWIWSHPVYCIFLIQLGNTLLLLLAMSKSLGACKKIFIQLSKHWRRSQTKRWNDLLWMGSDACSCTEAGSFMPWNPE